MINVVMILMCFKFYNDKIETFYNVRMVTHHQNNVNFAYTLTILILGHSHKNEPNYPQNHKQNIC